MIATLRTLTKKSKLGFGKHKDCTVQDLLDRRKHVDLIGCYYKLTSINFTEDVLLELKIKFEERISKPGVDLDVYRTVLDRYPKRFKNKELEKMRPKNKPLTKQKLQSINHGH
jgi:hypothetical protein